MDSCETNFIVRSREVSTVWSVTFCQTVFWDINIFPFFTGVYCIEVSGSGGSTLISLIEVQGFDKTY